MRRLSVLAIPLLLIAACGGDDDTTADEPADDGGASEPGNPEGTYSMSGVLLTQLERQVTPWT